jgi:transcriptional regulator with PAS, ATPase and Fis domain
MTNHAWVKEFPGSIFVCDPQGILLEMNDRAAEQEDGQELIGSNILDCHPEPARTKFKQLLESGQPNIYTIEKKGKRKLIYQTPWYRDGKYAGFIELGLEIPERMPHFIREG